MKWKKYIVEVAEPWQVDMIYGVLYESGIESIEIESTECLTLNENEKGWDYCEEAQFSGVNKIIFYLQIDNYGKPVEIVNCLKTAANENEISIDIKNETVYEKDWSEGWKKYFKPIKITDRITIKPEWENYVNKKNDEVVIEINPGMAFGTGTHETTAMCIELLEQYVDENTDVLDVGCGSGILSIAAAKLGAKSITGIDIDKTVVEVAKKNVDINGLSNKVHIISGDLTKNITRKVDIVVANIMAEIIISMSKDIHNNLKGRKIFIVSGILIEKQKTVIDSLRENGFKILKLLKKGEWMAAAVQFSENKG